MNSLLSRFHPTRAGAEADLGFAITGDLPRPLDAKAFSKLYKAMDKVVKSLQNPRLSLSRSPPCLIDILPDIYMKLKDINNLGETGCGEQQDFYYITVNNIYDKCRRVNQLFKEHKDEILQESADSRKQLINLTIVIAYIFADLKALFNDVAHFDPNFRIAKEEAERWWKATFPGRVIVPWGTFKEQIMVTFPSLSKIELSRLKSTIDLTCNDHVSVFEFDVFTRLFAPWSMLMKNFKKLTFHPGYMASATFENVKTILSKHKEKPGSYVFRMSCTKLGFWSIGYVTDHFEQRRDRISQIVVRDGKPIVEALMEGAQKGYYLYPNGDPSNPDLSELMHVRPKPQFQVTEAQFEEYSMIGSTFQECKICNMRDKDIQLDLCGHFMCSKCLNQWLSKGTGCPFCRCEIRSTQAVVMQPFQPSARKEPDKSADGAVAGAKSETTASDDSVLGSLPPPSHSPPPLPPGYSPQDDGMHVNTESANATSAETAEITSTNEHPPAGPRPRAPSPNPIVRPTRTQPLPGSGTSPARIPLNSGSSDDAAADSHYINVTFPAQRNTMPLPEPPPQRTGEPPSSLPTPRRQSMTSPSTSSLTSPTSPAMTSPSSPAVLSPTSPTVASVASPTSTSPASAAAVTSLPGDEAPVPVGPPARGPVASSSRPDPPPAIPAARPRAKPTGAKDGDARSLTSLPPPPLVPLATAGTPPATPPTTALIPPSAPYRVRAGSSPLPPVPGPRQELRSLPVPPLPEPRVSVHSTGTLPSTPFSEDEYQIPIPAPEDEYHIPIPQDEYNTPLAQEDTYNVPLAQDDTYNVPISTVITEESEYNVPAAPLHASSPSFHPPRF